jgi:hypothetical protein
LREKDRAEQERKGHRDRGEKAHDEVSIKERAIQARAFGPIWPSVAANEPTCQGLSRDLARVDPNSARSAFSASPVSTKREIRTREVGIGPDFGRIIAPKEDGKGGMKKPSRISFPSPGS